jgi:hypothetical protein
MLSLPEPGLGHLYLGYLKRAAAWFSCQIVVVLATITGIHFGWPPTLILVLPAFLLLRLAGGLDALRWSRPAHARLFCASSGALT